MSLNSWMQAGKQVAAVHLKSLTLRVGIRVWRLECAVGPASVVMPDLDTEEKLELAAADAQEPVDALIAHAARA